jgi:hypothetical protein
MGGSAPTSTRPFHRGGGKEPRHILICNFSPVPHPSRSFIARWVGVHQPLPAFSSQRRERAEAHSHLQLQPGAPSIAQLHRAMGGSAPTSTRLFHRSGGKESRHFLICNFSPKAEPDSLLGTPNLLHSLTSASCPDFHFPSLWARPFACSQPAIRSMMPRRAVRRL